MRKFILPLLASLAVASPAFANEIRVEARGGVIWADDETEAVAGVAAGYDFDLGPMAFTGLEVSADKILTSGTKVAFGVTGRLGAKLGFTKVYTNGGYTTEPCDLCDGNWHAGAGVEQAFMGNLYGKVEYRRFFVEDADDANQVLASVGVKF